MRKGEFGAAIGKFRRADRDAPRKAVAHRHTAFRSEDTFGAALAHPYSMGSTLFKSYKVRSG